MAGAIFFSLSTKPSTAIDVNNRARGKLPFHSQNKIREPRENADVLLNKNCTVEA